MLRVVLAGVSLAGLGGDIESLQWEVWDLQATGEQEGAGGFIYLLNHCHPLGPQLY